MLLISYSPTGAAASSMFTLENFTWPAKSAAKKISAGARLDLPRQRAGGGEDGDFSGAYRQRQRQQCGEQGG